MIALAFRKHTNQYNESVKIQKERYSSDFQNNNLSNEKQYHDHNIPTINREFTQYIEM